MSTSDLSHNALLAISGDDATAFLHGQFTNDVQALAPGAGQWNGWCSAKGRLLATFPLIRGADAYFMLLPAQIAPAIQKRLGMYVLRSKVKVRDASAEFDRFGIVGPVPEAAAGVTPLGNGLAIAIVPHGADHGLGPVDTDASAWDLALVHAGIPIVVAATQDAFVPQMANFELVGGVSFRKGCYPGQEIVARTQYRGILKKRMALAHLDSARPEPGQSVYSAEFGDQSAGTVVNAAPAPQGGTDFLVVAQIESLRGGKIHLGAPDGAPIDIRSHPAVEAAPR